VSKALQSRTLRDELVEVEADAPDTDDTGPVGQSVDLKPHGELALE
jgi:hypothetical protein